METLSTMPTEPVSQCRLVILQTVDNFPSAVDKFVDMH